MNAPTSSIPLKKVLTTRETLIFFAAWGVVAFFVLGVNPDDEFISSWAITLPAGWLMYQVSFRWLLPRTFKTRFPLPRYMAFILLYGLTVFFVTSAILSMYMEDEAYFMVMGGITLSILFFIQAPVQWYVFKRQVRDHEELTGLRKELGQTEANIDLLRSQINPHFLFNALNTLYGLAIHEKAERTSEAIEKLGGMMRFMLQENVQEKISLARDIEYLNNYIALQRLRTDVSPGIKIQVDIRQEVGGTLRIAPMLLIPFIENAFKHGISLREESQIRISLERKDNTVYLDVFNTRHTRTEGDPEKNSNGIGLLNVKQRLHLVYPGRHELVIRETAHDYFVHLAITLAP